MATDRTKIAEHLDSVISFIEAANKLNQSERGESVQKEASKLAGKLVDIGLLDDSDKQATGARVINSKFAALRLASNLADRYDRIRSEVANDIGRPTKTAVESDGLSASEAYWAKTMGSGRLNK